MTEEIESGIEQSAASGIRRAQGDQGSMEEHDLADRIAADKYVAAKTAARSSGIPGLRFARVIPPGSA